MHMHEPHFHSYLYPWRGCGHALISSLYTNLHLKLLDVWIKPAANRELTCTSVKLRRSPEERKWKSQFWNHKHTTRERDKKKEGKKRARTNVCKFRVKGPWPRARSRTSTFVAVIYNNIYKILDTFIIIMKKNTFDLKKKKKERRWNLWVFLYYSVKYTWRPQIFMHILPVYTSALQWMPFVHASFFYIQPQ